MLNQTQAEMDVEPWGVLSQPEVKILLYMTSFSCQYQLRQCGKFAASIGTDLLANRACELNVYTGAAKCYLKNVVSE